MSLQETEQSRWFSMEVQPHEAALRAYLHARFPMLRDADDIVQETYTRLLKEKKAGRIRHARALMFTVVRNAALDFFRRCRTVPLEPTTHLIAANVIEEAPHAAETISQQQELEILAQAVQTLPTPSRKFRRFGAAEPKISARQPAGRSVIWRGRRRCGSEIFINRVHRQT